MKKLFFVICMMLMSVATFAQQGKMTVGIHGDYMIDSPKNFGIGANVGYEVINNVRGVAEFNYFLKKDGVSYWNVEVNAEYLFKVGDAFTIYPLAGIDLLGISVEGGGSDSKMGLNLGAGVEYVHEGEQHRICARDGVFGRRADRHDPVARVCNVAALRLVVHLRSGCDPVGVILARLVRGEVVLGDLRHERVELRLYVRRRHPLDLGVDEERAAPAPQVFHFSSLTRCLSCGNYIT